jgi:predicted dehydrogenase
MGAFTSEIMQRFAPRGWLPLSHCEAMVQHPEVDLVALCDIDTELLAKARERFHVSRTYANHEEMLAEVRPDILGIATRTPERPAIIESAISNGVRALHIEKPLCRDVSELFRLERALMASSLACTYGTLRRYMPIYHQARDLARSSRYGALRQVSIAFGAASLLWTHAHSIDTLLFMVEDARVERVSAQFSVNGFTRRGSILDGDPILLSALLEFSNGVTGLIGQGGGSDVVLHCDRGAVAVESDGSRLLCRYASGGSPYWDARDVIDTAPQDVAPSFGGTQLAIDRLVRQIRGRAPSSQPAKDKRAIIDGQRLLLACVQSYLRSGAAIDPFELDEDIQVTGRTEKGYA